MARTKPPSFDFFPDDFIAGTYHLPAEAVGIYVRLLCYQWNNGSIPSEENELARIAGVDANAMRTHMRTVMLKFVQGECDGLQNERLEKERLRKMQVIEKAKASAEKRWANKNTGKSDSQVDSQQCERNANAYPNAYPNAMLPTSNFQLPASNSLNTPLIPQGGESVEKIDPPQKPKRKPKAATVGEWSIPHGWDSEKLREALGAFERMRESIGKRIKDRANASMHFKSFDNADHLIYALEFAVANEYQGIKPDYRPTQKPEYKKPSGTEHLPFVTMTKEQIEEMNARRERSRQYNLKKLAERAAGGGVDMRNSSPTV